MIGLGLGLPQTAMRSAPLADISGLFPPGAAAFWAGGFIPPVPQPDRLFAGGVAGFWAGYFKVKK